ncbi:unnamed protein product [Aphanomyces euteiches]
MPPTQRNTVKTKLEAIEMLKTMSSYEVAKVFDVDPSTVRKWAFKQAKYIEVPNKKSKNLPGAGRHEALPGPQALVDYITERRSRERAVTSIHVINFMKRTQRAWLNSYMATHDTDKAYNNLMRMIQRFCDRHGFSKQKPHKIKRNQEELEELRDEFAEDFHRRYAAYGSDDVYNVDETAVYFDMPPRTIWSIRGGNSALKRFDDLMSAFKHDTVKALRASGTEEEYNEREQLLQDISDLITESNDRKQASKDDRTNKNNKREVDGELIRSAALGQIKRTFENGTKIDDNGDPSIPEKRQRRAPEPADFMIEFASVLKASNELKRDEITLAQRKMDLDEARFAYEKAEREARFNLEKGEREIQMKMMMELVKKLNKD